MNFQQLTISGKQYTDNQVSAMAKHLLLALKNSQGNMVSFGDKVMVYAGNLKELCQLYKDCRIDFTVVPAEYVDGQHKNARLRFEINDDGVKVQGSFAGWQMGQTVAIYKGKKVHIKEIMVLSWSFVVQPVIVEVTEPVTMPLESPEPVEVIKPTPKPRKPRTTRKTPVKPVVCPSPSWWDRLWGVVARYAPALGSIVL